ncbi:unnamed protein product, partial [Closterium sp. NIES-64]
MAPSRQEQSQDGGSEEAERLQADGPFEGSTNAANFREALREKEWRRGGGGGSGGMYKRLKSKVMDRTRTMSGYNRKNITKTITVKFRDVRYTLKFKDVRYKVQTAKAGSWDPRHCLPALLAPKEGGIADGEGAGGGAGGDAEAGAGGKAGAEVREKEILHGISGSVAPGEVLAIMGPSGGGKTTFLNVLGGRFKQGNMAGTVTYNDMPYSKSLNRKLGFVPQVDEFYAHLTVRETLMYAAVLRLPKELSWAEKVERADENITLMGLD